MGCWQIIGMAKATHNLHVPRPRALHERLRAESARSGRPVTALAREAIEFWIEEQQRLAVHESIAEYAREMAGALLLRGSIRSLQGRKEY